MMQIHHSFVSLCCVNIYPYYAVCIPAGISYAVMWLSSSRDMLVIHITDVIGFLTILALLAKIAGILRAG